MYLVIDIGGTYTKYGYYDKEGHCQTTQKYPTIKTTVEEFYQKIEELIIPSVEGIAISMPGLLNSTTGYIEAITLLPFLAGHNIIDDLFQRCSLPITVENDAKCATLGEMWKGSLNNVQNGMMIVFGSGVGGTIIFNGKIIKSPHNKAGEIGSILMPMDNDYTEMTNFGRHNSANTFIHDASQILQCEPDGEYIFKNIKTHQAIYTLFQQYCREIAFMIYNLDYILDLDTVCIGGGISEQHIFIDTIQQQFSLLRQAYKEDSYEPTIKACTYKNEANLLGALYHHLQKPIY